MAADPVVPLCSVEAFTAGPFGDLVSDLSAETITAVLAEATRECEDITGRRLAPFTLTETLRVGGQDPDEYAGSTMLPMSIQSTLGASYASAIGTSDLVRHCWLSEYPARYPDLWAFTLSSVTIIRSYGGTQAVPVTQILDGPDNTGHLWFQLGLFLPEGSRVRATYGGGYSTSPASLVRACKYVAAAHVVRELNPDDSQHNPDQLYASARMVLQPWVRT